MLELNQELELEIIDISHDASGVAKHSNYVIFVENALPKQTVLAKITKTKKNYAFAETLQVISQADYYIPSKCEHSAQCGACPLISVPYDLQLTWKEKIVQTNLKKLANIDFSHISTKASDKQFHYRNKMNFAFSENALGLSQKNTNNIIEITNCQAITPIMQEIVNKSREYLSKTFPNFAKFKHLVIRQATSGLSVEIIAKENIASLFDFAKFLFANFNQIEFVIHSGRHNDFNLAYAQDVYFVLDKKLQPSKGILSETLEDKQYEYSFDSFMQVNSSINSILLEKIAKLANVQDNTQILDLYCGVGTLAQHLAKPNCKIVGIDNNKKAIHCAKNNAIKHNLANTEYVYFDAQNYLLKQKLNIEPDLIIVDPARSGLTPAIIGKMLKLKAKKIIYISCDPASLARDLKNIFEKSNYKIKHLECLDMFPNTSHIETLVSLEQ